MGIVGDLGRWFWRLLPGNPILVRVVAQGSQRARHNWARFAYLAAMFAVVLLFGSGALSAQSESLAELSKSATQTFTTVSVVQLLLMAFIAPVFCAGAITQEKDSNTFDILLTTPLSTGQIVLGMLFSRIYFVWALLLSGLPIFCITMVFGGVTRAEVFESFGLAACTGLVTGALAIMIGVAKVGTRRTIFSFFLGVAVYLLVLWTIGMTNWGQLNQAPLGPSMFGVADPQKMSWLAPVHPFLALLVVTGQTPAPLYADVAEYGWPWAWLLAYPQYGYMTVMTLASTTMIVIALWFVRRGAKEGELTWWSRIVGTLKLPTGATVERRRAPRRVWANPIAWREAATRASAAGRSLLRWAFIIVGAVLGVVLLIAHEQGWWGLNPAQPATTRTWLIAVCWIELAVILLLVTNIAATTLTREKETATLELLLTTPLTSRYILAGMLRGLVSFVVPMIAVPAFMLALFVFADLVRRSGPPVTTPEAFLLVPILMTAFTAAASMVGLYFSLQAKRTVQAVMVSTVIVIGGSGLLFGCGLMLGNGGAFLAAVTQPFTPFHAIAALIDLDSLFGPGGAGGATPGGARVARFVSSLIAVGAYAALTYSIYSGMIRSFDMTIRRQSA